MINASSLILPGWKAPQSVKAFTTTRLGGLSSMPFDELNLGMNAGDDPHLVQQNRTLLRAFLPADPVWLKQVHGNHVSTPSSRESSPQSPFEADAAVTKSPNEVLAILTADCMPVLFASKKGDVIGAAHAGWRGLSSGVLENTVREMRSLSPGLTAQEISVWMGPAIGPEVFEVGQDVLEAFAPQGDDVIQKAFTPIKNTPGKYLANLYLLAKYRLHAMGIDSIDGGDFCTYTDSERFFSYRRDGDTGRFASFIWISKS